MSIAAIDVQDEFLNFEPDEAQIARKMISASERTIIAADHSKFGASGMVRMAGFEDVAILVTDKAPPSQFKDRLAVTDVKMSEPVP